ncbi:UNKNOWN [Stylonychia lemnae]|uniref:Uncharacterized protein n=1 Tax=Stylonychia lemnae TaxID=5949 RepID=A0A078BE40_STYLE|nr:UNKNOWN [Stylonychia lemnae]|eukprot:CDW91838.1 UNKNOWN [Stylonychia lemnae]
MIKKLNSITNAKEFDAWNMFLQEFLQLLYDIFSNAEDFDVEILTSYFLGDVNLIINSLSLLSEVIKTEQVLFFDKKHRTSFVRLLENITLRAHYIQKSSQNQGKPELLELLNAIKLLIVELVNVYVNDMIRIIRQMGEKNKQLMIELIESLDHNPPVPINKSKIALAKQQQFQNLSRQSSSNGFNSIQQYSTASSQMSSANNQSRPSILQSSGSSIVGSQPAQLIIDRTEDSIISPSGAQQRNYHQFRSFHNVSTPQNQGGMNPFTQVQAVSYPPEEELFKIIVVNFEEGLQILKNMFISMQKQEIAQVQFKELPKFIQIIIKSMFQHGFNPKLQSGGTTPADINQGAASNEDILKSDPVLKEIFETFEIMNETINIIQQLLPSFLNALVQLPSLSKPLQKQIFRTLYIDHFTTQNPLNNQQQIEDDMLKVLLYYLNKRNPQFIETLLTMIMVFLLKQTSVTLSKEILEQLIDSVINLINIFPEQKNYRKYSLEIIIIVLSQIEQQMEQKVIDSEAFDEQTFQDQIKHKVEYQQVPFIEEKKSRIIQSNGDPIPIIEGVFKPKQKPRSVSSRQGGPGGARMQNQRSSIQPNSTNIKSFDFVIQKNERNNQQLSKVNQSQGNISKLMNISKDNEQIQMNQQVQQQQSLPMFPQILPKVQSMQSLQDAQYNKKQTIEKGPPHLRMKRYGIAGIMPDFNDIPGRPIKGGLPIASKIETQRQSLLVPLKGFSDQEWDQAVNL